MYGMTDNHIDPYTGPTYEEEWASLLRLLFEDTAGQWFRTGDTTDKIASSLQAGTVILPAEIEYALRVGSDFSKSLGRYLTGKAGRSFGGLTVTSRTTGGKHGRLYKIYQA